MKATDKNLTLNPPLVHGQQPLVQAERIGEIKPVADQQHGHSDVDQTQAQPVRVEAGPASSAVDAGQSDQLQVRRQQRSSGVRTKKLKTEQVGSMPRVARASFHSVHDVVGQAKQLLGTKPHQTGTRE